MRDAFLADDYSLQGDGKYNVHGMFTHIYASAYPTEIGDSSLFVTVEHLDDDTGIQPPLTVVLRSMSSQEIISQAEMSLPQIGEGFIPLLSGGRFQLKSLVLPSYGKYQFEIYQGDALLRTVTLWADRAWANQE